MNLIKYIEITSKDLDLEGKALGPDMGNLKGKTTRSTPEVVQDKTIEILKELLNMNCDIILSIDRFEFFNYYLIWYLL